MENEAHAITVTREGDVVEVRGISPSRLPKEQAGGAYERVATLLIRPPAELRFALRNVQSDNYYALALIDASEKLAERRGVRVALTEASPQLLESLKKLGDTDEDAKKERRRVLKGISAFILAGETTLKLVDDAKSLLGFIGDLAESIWDAIRQPSKIRWRDISYYMDKAGSDAVPIISLICFLMGVILAFQGIVQMGKFGLKIFVADLVGLAIVKELGPLMVAMICTGRAGSAFAAEIGTMKVNEELDAMETMGLKSVRFLVIPKIVALVAVMPLLTVVGDIVGVIGGMVVSVVRGGLAAEEYYLRTIHAMTPWTMTEGLVKSVVFAALIAAIGCFRGFQADNDAKGVGRAATSAVVSGIFLVVLADAFITMLFNG